ncbi:hypothetical protein F4Z99_02390 [Candidatus Poribacteria bacterium]|nr:hypothetical protein [Candidatus Poribacteria bacterium]MYB00949.1 hypothetical protein [Candidatus Poribacteria bacterium]
MKISSTFYVFVLLTMLLTFSPPFVTLAQQNLLAEAVVDAERDAPKYADSGHWFLMGCIFQNDPAKVDESISLPPTRLLGKSPEYVRLYAATYGEKVKKIRTNSIRVGMAAFCISSCAGFAMIMSADEF